ncbi:MAG: DUF2459 domain-containing protein [Nostocaceae cyanobacterium]|nr:DUF2459 domain-containing protein [Nostocaceae cyanobacterium]
MRPKICRYSLLTTVSAIALLFLTTLIPRKWNNYPQVGCNFQICVHDTGIHTNIIVPLANQVFNWGDYLSLEKIGIDSNEYYEYLSFGWGDRDFMIQTPRLEDIRFSTTFNALFLPTPSVVYIQAYPSLPNYLNLKCVRVNKDNYLQLIKFIQAAFQVDDQDKQIRIANGHSPNAGFYKANGSYSILRNCNSWTAEGLRSADINTPVGDGLSTAIMWHLRSGCE